MADFNLINRTQTMLHYLFSIADKAPKKLRDSFITELRTCGCHVLEYIITANNFQLTLRALTRFVGRFISKICGFDINL